jgi:cardiolipin synthase
MQRCLTGLMLSVAISIMGCATLPDTDALIARHSAQEASFETARGPVSAKRNAAILAGLQRKSGDLDILDKQMALEQAISDSPLVLGNKVSLLQDGAATYASTYASTYAAMFGAIRQAKDHINLETYTIEDDATGKDFATLLLAAQARGVQIYERQDALLHAKTAVIDGAWSTVGSTNLD